MPFLHIIVLGYGRFDETSKPCLESLLPQVNGERVTIFDNGSPDDSAIKQSEFAKQHPQLTSLLNPENLGFAGGMNAAVASFQEEVEWLMLVGNDTIFHHQALETMLLAMHAAPSHIGILGPMTNSAGNAQDLSILGNNSEEVFTKWKRVPHIEQAIIRPLYRADFFCVAIRKSVWDLLGGLDLSYGRGYYEDFDFSMRASQKGIEGGMIENALVYHQGSASFKSDVSQSALIKNNKKIFVNRFPNAQLRHRRLDHYKTLQHVLNTQIQDEDQGASIQIIRWRIESLLADLPKSPLKRMLWRFRIKQITEKLSAKFLIHF